MLNLSDELISLSLHEPGDGFYRGTRFDRSGIFDSLLFDGVEMAGRWFSAYDPFMHDAVCGPAEEFGPLFYEQAPAGGQFLKIGVGLLTKPDDAPYDRFRLYEIADEGLWETDYDLRTVWFHHVLPGWYEYSKVIAIPEPGVLEIEHTLDSLGPELRTEVYNHNFWTFGSFESGPSRLLDFPFRPAGHWRSAYDSVGLTDSGIRFGRVLAPGESVYMGDLHAAGTESMPYAMSIEDRDIKIEVSGSIPVTHSVFWANHRVACLEPYNDISTPAFWIVKYNFSRK